VRDVRALPRGRHPLIGGKVVGIVDPWVPRYEGFDPATEGRREALCTLGNGYLATRGALPEASADGVHYPGTYAAGCYNRLTDQVDGQPVENESLVNLPNWLVLAVAPADGLSTDGPPGSPEPPESPESPAADLVEHCLELDLKRGVLVRRSLLRHGDGRETRIVQRRFVHMAQPHLCGLHTTVVPSWSGQLRLRSALDGTVTNSGVARYRDLSGRHLRARRTERTGPDTVLLEVETTQSAIRIAEAARTRVTRGGQPVPARTETVEAPGWIGQDLTIDVAEGDEIAVEKLVAVYTSRDPAVSDPALEAVDWLGASGGFEELLAEHVTAWSLLWRRFDVRLPADGRLPRVALATRLHEFHLMQTLSVHSAQLDVGVPARGLHGEAYRGHVLWDELFVLPLLNLRLPAVARALLGYRYRRLPWARRAAREDGHRGAMFPWQSGSDGREESQRLHLNPLSGRWETDPTRLERHVGLAVAYNVWQYYQATGDRLFLADQGAEMVGEVARFFGDLATYDPGRGRFVIRGVMGPDEFHSGYPDRPEPGIDNNAYTNVLAVWTLRRALEILRMLPRRRREELVETLGLTDAVTEHWRHLTKRMYVPFQADGAISQFDGYDRLAELDWDAYRAHYGDLQRLDRVLSAERDNVNRYQVSKQADVLMLFYLLSAEELDEILTGLGYSPDAEMIPRTIDYYLARTCHGSTLSAVVHAWVLARANRGQAPAYLARALDSDITDIQGGTTAEGIHLAGHGRLGRPDPARLRRRRDQGRHPPSQPVLAGRSRRPGARPDLPGPRAHARGTGRWDPGARRPRYAPPDPGPLPWRDPDDQAGR
jgi:trehalose 6-phosphate phosphatase